MKCNPGTKYKIKSGSFMYKMFMILKATKDSKEIFKATEKTVALFHSFINKHSAFQLTQSSSGVRKSSSIGTVALSTH
jgi:hypothetical protein